MISTALTGAATPRLRRATFVPALTDTAHRRLRVGAIFAAVAVSSAALGTVVLLAF